MPLVLNPVLEIDAGMKEARSPLNKKHERFLVSIISIILFYFCFFPPGSLFIQAIFPPDVISPRVVCHLSRGLCGRRVGEPIRRVKKFAGHMSHPGKLDILNPNMEVDGR